MQPDLGMCDEIDTLNLDASIIVAHGVQQPMKRKQMASISLHFSQEQEIIKYIIPNGSKSFFLDFSFFLY